MGAFSRLLGLFVDLSIYQVTSELRQRFDFWVTAAYIYHGKRKDEDCPIYNVG